MKKIPFILALLIFASAVWMIKKPAPQQNLSSSPLPSPSPLVPREEIFDGVGYTSINTKLSVSILNQNLIAPTRIKITPDGQFLLITQLTGEILAFNRTETGWSNTAYQVAKVDTEAPGFPPDEFGLVGLVFSANYSQNHKAFLLYSYLESENQYSNRIATTTLQIENDRLTASPPAQIFQAVTPGNVSHQITDGIGIMHNGKPHLVFAIGEGFHANFAQDETAEAGKLMMIQEDGTYPEGPRPYPNRPKIEALGIRNAYVMVENPHDPKHRWLIGDTGPDKYDRLMYTRTASDSGTFEPVNFGWDGDTSSLAKAIRDPNLASVRDIVLYRFPETRTITGLAFHPGGIGGLPQSTAKSQTILMTLFGTTGSPQNSPGKEIWLGTLSNLTGQPRVTFKPIIKRSPEAEGKLGNPVGLEVDLQTGDFFFADVLEGKIYQVTNSQQ